MTVNFNSEKSSRFSITQLITRFLVGAIILSITAALTPGFSISNIWALLGASIALAVIDYAVSSLIGKDISPFGKGISGFLLAAAVIYTTQFFIAGMAVSFTGALLGSLVYGVVDMIIPGKGM